MRMCVVGCRAIYESLPPVQAAAVLAIITLSQAKYTLFNSFSSGSRLGVLFTPLPIEKQETKY